MNSIDNPLPITVLPDTDSDSDLFEAIARDIDRRGYSICHRGLPGGLATLLWQRVSAMPAGSFSGAGVGRGAAYNIDGVVRSDEICWIDDSTRAGNAWLHWSGALQKYLNRRLLLGLFSFESHFAHYARGDFYKKHRDAFDDSTNRVLSLVVYLNRDWLPEQGGELVLYTADGQREIARVAPEFATLVVFLSEQFPHEVLPAERDRFSIAGWFRVNGSGTGRVDPPL